MPRDYSDPGERTPLRTLIQQNPDLRIEQDDYNINVTLSRNIITRNRAKHA